MNYVPNQNGKVLGKMLSGANPDAVKITLTVTLFQSIPHPFPRS